MMIVKPVSEDPGFSWRLLLVPALEPCYPPPAYPTANIHMVDNELLKCQLTWFKGY